MNYDYTPSGLRKKDCQIVQFTLVLHCVNYNGRYNVSCPLAKRDRPTSPDNNTIANLRGCDAVNLTINSHFFEGWQKQSVLKIP
jgi:hypothetical protein